VRQGRGLQMRIGPRVIPLQVMPDGSYVMAGGTLVGATVRLAKEADGRPHLEVTGIETVRRTTGLGTSTAESTSTLNRGRQNRRAMQRQQHGPSSGVLSAAPLPGRDARPSASRPCEPQAVVRFASWCGTGATLQTMPDSVTHRGPRSPTARARRRYARGHPQTLGSSGHFSATGGGRLRNTSIPPRVSRLALNMPRPASWASRPVVYAATGGARTDAAFPRSSHRRLLGSGVRRWERLGWMASSVRSSGGDRVVCPVDRDVFNADDPVVPVPSA
jgi:hypothetical protein